MANLLSEVLEIAAPKTLAKALLGVAAPLAGVGVSFEDRLLMWLRIASVAMGFAVSLAMFISIVSSRRRRRKREEVELEREELALKVQQERWDQKHHHGQINNPKRKET